MIYQMICVMFATTLRTERVMRVGARCLVCPKICTSSNIIVKSLCVTFGLAISRLTCGWVCLRAYKCNVRLIQCSPISEIALLSGKFPGFARLYF